MRDWIIRLGVAAMASLISAILGPFATYENFTFLERLGYWGGLIMGLVFPAFLVRTILYRYLTGSPLRQDLIAACVLSVIIGPVVWAFNLFVMDFDIATLEVLIEHIGIVAMICLVPVSIRAYLRMSLGELNEQPPAQAEAEVRPPEPAAAPAPTSARASERPAPEPAAPEPAASEAQTTFLRRLDEDKRGEVLRVSADDHQVEVWTDRGASKLRLRFGDALEELAEFDGTRIHRSHWVAFSWIEAVTPSGRRHTLHLRCGSELPVSQNGLKALRDAGVAIQDRRA